MILSNEQRDAVIALARAAAAEILAVYESPFAIEHKDDRSPLTAADLASQRCIVAGLRALTPQIPVLSEESKGLDIAARRQWRRFWLPGRAGPLPMPTGPSPMTFRCRIPKRSSASA